MVDDQRPIDWFWEGNVQDALIRHLEANGWFIAAVADPARRNPGPDIDARKVGRPLYVEVKGFPSASYRDPRRSGERKPTNPRLQARHWFSQAFFKAVTLADRATGWETAICLPEWDLYEKLVGDSERSLRALGIGVYFVRQDGSVVERLDHISRGEALARCGIELDEST